MRILQLGKFFPIHGGVEKVMYDLAQGLSQRNIHCDMLMASADGYTEPIVLNSYCTIYKTKGVYKLLATYISPQMIAMLRKIQHRYDIIHIHHPDPMAALALFLSGYKGKVVLHWHSDILKQRIALKLYKAIQEWLIKRADLILCTTPLYAKTEHLNKGKHKVQILPIGVNPLTPNPKLVEEIQNQYFGKKIVYSLGRLVGYKGFEYLIDAAKYLPDDYVVLIGGRGPLRAELSERIKANKVEEKVYLLGLIPDEMLSSYYGAAKLFCLSSVERTEAFAIVQVEAMTCGKPVVATNIPGSGVSWVNQHEFSGLNVPIKEGKALAEAIQAICDQEDIYQEYAKRARQRYHQFFLMKDMIHSCLAMYQQLNI